MAAQQGTGSLTFPLFTDSPLMSVLGAEAKESLKAIIQAMSRTKLVEEDESYLHYEFTSLLLRFVDDVEFLFDDESKTLHFRSASRTGYSDLGVNRKRMEEIRSLVIDKL